MAARLATWAAIMAGIALLVLGVSGQWRDPWLWTYVGLWAALSLYPALVISPDLARERFKPPTEGEDRRWLRVIRLVAFGSVIVGALDVGRWHVTSVPDALRLLAVVGTILFSVLIFRSMFANHYFSPVVRIQTERGHRVVDAGPYAIIRHPGYLGMIVAIPFSALLLGSWLGFGLAAAYSALILRRVLFEDAFLRRNLQGYAEYAARVPYRLVPGMW